MSRCFPFPPPGYDQKDRPDDVNLIIKEKEKQKKKKNKDKKDKDKKERSEGKHKEDKERKHKKHKEKDNKKDKHKSSDEKKIVEGSLDNQNGDKILAELGKRVRNDDEATKNQMVQKNTLVEQRKVNSQGKVEENSDRMLPNTQENGYVGNFSRENQNKVEGSSLACEVEKIEKKKEGKEKTKDRKSDGHKTEDREKNRKVDEKKRKKEKKKEKEKKERSKEEIKQRQNGDNVLDCRGPSDLLMEKRDSQGNLRNLKEPQLNGFLHDNEKRPGNMSRHHQVGQNGSVIHSSQNIINSSVDKGPVITNPKGIHSSPKIINSPMDKGPVITNQKGIHSSPKIINSSMDKGPVITNHKASGILSPHPVIKNATPNNHVIKNGLISPSNVAKVEHGVVRKHKADDKSPSSYSFPENGNEKTEPKVDKGVNLQGPDFNRKMEHKEVKINGLLEGKKHTSSKPSSKAKEKFDTSMKPPHPDSKYLSQILHIPEVEWPQFDDEEWLFGCKDSKRPKLASSSEIEWTKPVWAEAIRLESEDVTALPYVIPY